MTYSNHPGLNGLKLESDKPRVVCVACGRMIVALKNGHPRYHFPFDGLRPRSHQQNSRGPCDGMNYPGEPA